MASAKVVKETAKTALKGKHLRYSFFALIAVFVFVATDLISQAFSLVAGMWGYYILNALLWIFLSLPILYGFIRVLRRMLWGVEDSHIMLFYYFSDFKLYKKALLLTLNFILRVGVCGVVIFIPTVVIRLLASTQFYDVIGISMPVWTSGLWPIEAFVTTLSFVIFFLIAAKYYLVPFLFVADEEMEIAEAFHMSRVISKKTAFDFIILTASFILWILLSFLLAPLVFTLPYFVTAYLVHSRFAVANYNMYIQKNQQSESTPFYAE